MQKVGIDGNREMIFQEKKKAKCLTIWKSFGKFARGTRTINKLKHKRRRGGRLI
jgi:hypothetical protein